MKRIFTAFTCLFLTTAAFAQTVTAWRWAKVEASAPITINPELVRQTVAAHGDKMLWGNIMNKKYVSNLQYGDYSFAEYDTTHTAISSTVVSGKLSVIASDADQNGNWYVLATYRDTLSFANGKQLVQPLAAQSIACSGWMQVRLPALGRYRWAETSLPPPTALR